VSPTRGIPTSRAYWELKAEQMLNRVFQAEAPIEVEIIETAAPNPNGGRRRRSAHALAALLQRRPELLPIAVTLSGLAVALVAVLLTGYWSSQQQALRQERNLVLLERLRNLAPAAPAATSTAGRADADADLPPPPPTEPWMEELAQLPAGNAPPAAVLKVPFNPDIPAAAPAATGPGGGMGAGGGEALPQLVGVVQVPGRSGSAIFQIGASSTSASVGDAIGGSGWRLRSASGDGAVIERGGQVRRLSISNGF
jgi:hypothetical protein